MLLSPRVILALSLWTAVHVDPSPKPVYVEKEAYRIMGFLLHVLCSASFNPQSNYKVSPMQLFLVTVVEFQKSKTELFGYPPPHPNLLFRKRLRAMEGSCTRLKAGTLLFTIMLSVL